MTKCAHVKCKTTLGAFRPPRPKKVGRLYKLTTKRGREGKKKDAELVELRRKWVKAAKRTPAWENMCMADWKVSVAFCRRHFRADTVQKVKGKYRLLPGVVPEDPAGEDQLTDDGFIKTEEHRRQDAARSNPEALAAAEAAAAEKKKAREDKAAARHLETLLTWEKPQLVDRIMAARLQAHASTLSG